MTDQTPIERLELAVQAFWRELQQRDGDTEASMVTAWVIGFSTVRFQDDPDYTPEVHGMQYAIGPRTSIATGAGLARFLDVVHERAMYSALSAD